jgi:hypothetical protein
MNPNIPFYITGMLFVIVIILIVFTFYTLNYALKKLEYPDKKRKITLLVSALLLGTWLIFTTVVSLQGMLQNFSTTPPRVMIILIPAVLGIIYISSSSRVNAYLSVIPYSWLLYIQSFRILMEVLLWLMFLNNLIPVQMSFEGLNYDILAGLSAPIIGYYALSVHKWPRISALLWNFAGFLLVTNITLISILSSPVPFRQFMNEPANTIVSFFPFVWIPAFIVPFAFLMHVLSIKQIIRNYN